MSRKSASQLISSYLFDFILVFFSFIAASVISNISVHLPANKSLQISNLNLGNGYNPEENYLRVVLLILFGFLIYIGLKKLSSNDKLFRRVVIALLSFGFFGSILMPNVNVFRNNIDTFHHGEQLSPAQAFGGGKRLYSDLFVLHGAGDDIILPYLALNLPKTNPDGGVGSYFFVVSSFQLLSAVLFFIMLSRLFKSTLVFLLASLWFSLSYYITFYNVRDAFIWLLVMGAAYVLLQKPSTKTRAAVLATGGFLASASFFYSIDRAFVAILIALLVGVVLTFFREVSGNWRFDWRLTKERLLPAIYILIGGIVAQILAMAMLGFSQYKDFIKTTFVVIPKYQGYLFDSPLHDLTPKYYTVWLPVIMAILGLIMLFFIAKNQFENKKSFTPHLVLGGVMYVASVLFMKLGYGRPDFGHIAYSTPLLFVTVFYLSYVAYEEFRNSDIQLLWPVALALILLFTPISTISLDRVGALASIKVENVEEYFDLPRKNDREWLPADVVKISDYIKSRTTKDDPMFIFTQQPIYYYLTERQNSTRFYIPWFADPAQLTNVLLQDLIKNPPKIILYSIRDGTGWDQPDGYDMATRTPEVNAWILTNYRKQTRVESALFLERE